MLKFIDKVLGVGFILLIWLIIFMQMYHMVMECVDLTVQVLCNGAIEYTGMSFHLDLLNRTICMVLIICSSAIFHPYSACHLGFIQLMLSIPPRLILYYQRNIQLSLYGTQQDIHRLIDTFHDPGWFPKSELLSRVLILFIPVEKIVIF
jgi:hypothetical protein